MATKLTQIEGIGDSAAEKLHNAQVKSVEDLLEKGATKKGRKLLAETSGLDEKKILKYVNHADLFRIKGIGGQFSELLEKAGVDTVKELRNRNAENLHARLKEVNTSSATRTSGTVPGLEVVRGFIQQAKELDPKVSH